MFAGKQLNGERSLGDYNIQVIVALFSVGLCLLISFSIAEGGNTLSYVAPSRRMLVFFHIYLDHNYDFADHEVN
jgi:hypothetical protein